MKYILKKIKKFSLSVFERAVSYPVTTVLIVTGVVMAWCSYVGWCTISSNNYFDPFVLTFTKPLTYQMSHIIAVYHYVMSFLVFIMLLTFGYLFFSLKLIKVFVRKEDYKNRPLFNLRFYELPFMFDFYKENYKEFVKSRKFTHASVLEFFWAVLPAVILGFIAYPSFLLLYGNENFADPIYNISVLGNQWFWSYEYNDFNIPLMVKYFILDDHIKFDKGALRKYYNNKDYFYGIGFNEAKIKTEIPPRVMFDSNLTIYKDPKYPRLLCTDEILVLPSSTPLRMIVTATDVIHSWAVPSYGVKVDAVPGRLNQVIINVPVMGTAWGQCSELCGVNHAFMPIEIKTIHRDDFTYYLTLKIIDCGNPFVEAYVTKNRINPFKAILKTSLVCLDAQKMYSSELYSDDLKDHGWIKLTSICNRESHLLQEGWRTKTPLCKNVEWTVNRIFRTDAMMTTYWGHGEDINLILSWSYAALHIRKKQEIITTDETNI